MAEHKKSRKPKRATDKRRTYAATLGAKKVDPVAGGEGNGAARTFAIFNDRRTGKLGMGKRAA